ncbi:MAG TPA: hypothetical protein VIL29_03860 [Pseudothermotoga sp.]
MIEKIEELKTAISSLFDTVEINTDTVLSRENTAVIYVEGFNISFKTYHLKDIEQQVAIIFNVKSSAEEALAKVDEKLDELLDAIFTVFDQVLNVDVKFSYVANRNLMFTQFKFNAR